MKDFILEIHESPTKLVLITAGGGSEAISELLKYGNGSATVLDLRVPYTQKAFEQVVKFQPEKYVSPATARNMAVAAYEQAVNLLEADSEDDVTNVWGFGCTSALVKDNEQPYPDGSLRKHRIYVSAHGKNKTISWGVILTHGKSREEEERLNALLILELIGYVSGLSSLSEYLGAGADSFTECLQNKQTEEIVTPYPVSVLCNNPLLDKHQIYVEAKNGNAALFAKPLDSSERIVFPGSFNPIHAGHRKIAQAASDFKKLPVGYEISVKNADKPTLDYISIYARSKQFGEDVLYLTSAATFLEKSRLFPGATFLIGYDTLLRIGERKYYQDADRAFSEMKRNGASFLVALRGQGELPEPLISQGFSDELLSLVEWLPRDNYIDDGESSTTMRQNGFGLEKF